MDTVLPPAWLGGSQNQNGMRQPSGSEASDLTVSERRRDAAWAVCPMSCLTELLGSLWNTGRLLPMSQVKKLNSRCDVIGRRP